MKYTFEHVLEFRDDKKSGAANRDLGEKFREINTMNAQELRKIQELKRKREEANQVVNLLNRVLSHSFIVILQHVSPFEDLLNLKDKISE